MNSVVLVVVVECPARISLHPLLMGETAKIRMVPEATGLLNK